MMKKLIILLGLVCSIGVYGQKIADLPDTTATKGSDLLIVDQSDSTRNITVSNFFGTVPVNVVITPLATSNTTVLTPTSTGLVDTLETADITEVTLDTLDVNYITVNSRINYEPPHGSFVFHDSAITLTMTADVWSSVTNPTNTLFTSAKASNVTFAGDSITISVAGGYMSILSLSFAGTASDNFEIALFKNNVLTTPITQFSTASTKVNTITLPGYYDAAAVGDDFTLKIRNTASDDDAVIKACSWVIWMLY